ncbi:Aste57867_17489 [Aphanomyces stellatus]|uniref:Aste57867_17489 protein n=1 Tax=Aphanomyces stellatus TaxID=120398 RepID=A0A485L806_9STRA|nr:hypothetical protein As57867_017429 [Aphanomyces stellatus]VFT94242.1 Aste57867_17489 [Aphanomyces stellatus]
MVSPVNRVTYTLFRGPNHRWCISYIQDLGKIGTSSDVDFYTRLSPGIDPMPPQEGWRPWPLNAEAILPAPVVSPITTPSPVENAANDNVGAVRTEGADAAHAPRLTVDERVMP